MASQETKEDAHYHAAVPISPSCRDCAHYCPLNFCNKVEGWISPGGWCDYFEHR